MSTKPTFIFISGGLNNSSPWTPLRTALHAVPRSYNTSVVELPSIAPSAPLDDFQPDVDAIRQKVLEHVENDEDAVVVMHSYGGEHLSI
jgi:pimeloyl-ACP methyl ester carboxylesterase